MQCRGDACARQSEALRCREVERLELHQLAQGRTEHALQSALRIVTRQLPRRPPKGYARVRVCYAGLNYADLLIALGKYQVKPKLPCVLGAEASGFIENINIDTEGSEDGPNLAIGDAVVAFLPPRSGTFASVIDVPLQNLIPVPVAADGRLASSREQTEVLKRAAAFPIAAGTAHVALCERAKLQRGEYVLVTGASGGTGALAVGIAKALGARVIAAIRANDARKVSFVKSLLDSSADVLLDVSDVHNRRLEISQQIMQATQGRGVDVVLDVVGGELAKIAVKCLRWSGRFVVAGFAGSQDGATSSPIPAHLVLTKNLSIHGIYWGSYLQHQPDVIYGSFRALRGMLKAGSLQLPRVDQVYRLEDAAGALASMARGGVLGKIVIELPRDELIRPKL